MSDVTEGEVIETTAVVKWDSTAQAVANFVDEQVVKQRKLPWIKRRELIQCSKPLTEDAVKVVDGIVRSLKIPYQFIAMIPVNKGGQLKPFITADGWFLKCRADPRGIWKLEESINIDKESQSVTASAIITLGSGQSFQGLQYHDLNDEKQKDGTANMTRMVNKAITQARGKAAFAAVGGQFPGVAEEYQDIADSNNGYTQAAPSVRASLVPENAAKLVGRAMSELGYSFPKVRELLGITTIADITDVPAAWAMLQSAKGEGK